MMLKSWNKSNSGDNGNKNKLVKIKSLVQKVFFKFDFKNTQPL